VSGWRERRDPVRPAAVAGVVRAVRLSLRATHAVESLLLLVAGVLVARAAMVVSEVEGPGAWGVALLCGLLAAGAWWLEHPVALEATARELDERLRHHGGLVTAFEIEARASPTPMEELVRQRVLARLRRGEALRALLPPLAVPIGAPVAAGLLLLLATDAREPAARPGADLDALAQGLARALSTSALDPASAGLPGEDEDGGLSRAQVQELQRVLSARGALPRTRDGWDEPDVLARVEELDRRVTDLAREVDPASELHTRLEAARRWLDALRMGLAADERGAAADGAAAEGATHGDGGALTAGAPDGTISGSSSGRDVPPMPSDPAAPSASAPSPVPPGLQAGSWWPAEYDAVVAAWVELSRAERAVEVPRR
jgi:hypothetical protein